MVTFLSFLVGLLLGFLVGGFLMAWFVVDMAEPVITKCSKSNDELTDTLLRLEEAIENGTIAFNGVIE